MQGTLLLSLILAVFVAIFAVQNSAPVTISFLLLNIQVSQALIIILSAAIGAILSLLLGLIKQFSLKRTVKERDKRIKNLKSEISSLNESLEPKENEDKLNSDKPKDLP